MVMNPDSPIKTKTETPSLSMTTQKNTMSETQSTKGKYVVLEHKTLPDRGFRFWTTNIGEINTEWYEAVAYTDSDEEALLLARKPNYMLIPSIQELEDYWREEIKKRNESI
jgi:hypothetical protein